MNSHHSTLAQFRGTVIVLSLLAGCARHSSDDESEQAPPPTVPVRAAFVSRGDIATTVEATGRTEALRQEKVLSPVAGRIITLRALEGTSFHTGDLMAVVRTKESQAVIAGAEKLMHLARTPQQQEEARNALAIAESSQSTLELRAKFDGSVSTRSVGEGEVVAENAELFTLVDLSSLVFVADVPLAALGTLRPGQEAEIRFSVMPRIVFHGVVGPANPQTELQSQTVKVRLRFKDVPAMLRTLLKTDIMGSARIFTGMHRHVLLIPRAALLRNDQYDTYTVVTITPDSLAKSITVSPGVLGDSLAEVSGEGLREGQRVITEGNYALADSTKVSVAETNAP